MGRALRSDSTQDQQARKFSVLLEGYHRLSSIKLTRHDFLNIMGDSCVSVLGKDTVDLRGDLLDTVVIGSDASLGFQTCG